MPIESIPADKLTWWVCQICGNVRAYASPHEHGGGLPVCECGEVGYFMQRIEFGSAEVTR